MNKAKYYYDTQTCKYERIALTWTEMGKRAAAFLAVSFLFSSGILYVYLRYADSPKEAMLRSENIALKENYGRLVAEVQKSAELLQKLQSRDAHIYRIMLEAKPLDASLRQAGRGGVDRYADLSNKSEAIGQAARHIDELHSRLQVQAKSQEQVLGMAKSRQKMLAAIPAIQPISNKELRRMSSGYGMRPHPIFKINRMHHGVDLVATRGTPIYATGSGVVSLVKQSQTGYGNQVVIRHGFGFETRYAHMQSFKVRVGQHVKRGDCIGYVGNTGASSAPHLHYEVMQSGKKVNPVHYFLDDITAQEYAELVRLASIENQCLS